MTADPLGDYNATSQILRYSALAKDVAVPRAPSAAESVFSATLRSSRGSDNGRSSPNPASNEELENALAEIARLTSENESFAVRLTEEEIARAELEVHLKASEERCLMIEQEVREECWAEMDEKMEEERKRWQSAWDDQTGRNDEHMDKKIELLSRGFQSKTSLYVFHPCLRTDRVLQSTKTLNPLQTKSTGILSLRTTNYAARSLLLSAN